MILRCPWVLPVSAPPIRDGFVCVQGGRIISVGPWTQRPRDAGDVTELGVGLLTPGLVNPHAHLELGCYEGLIPPAPFWDWIGKLIVLRRAPGQAEREAHAAAEGAWRLLRDGVTCVGDISRLNVAWRELKRIPIRKVCFVELLTLADDPPRTLAELRAGVAEVEEDERLTVGVTPHAPYTVPARDFLAAIRLAEELGRPWTTHLAETPEERAFLLGADAALPPLLADLVRQHGVRSPRCAPGTFLGGESGARGGALAHLNYADETDAGRLAAAGHVGVYCPRAHHYFGHPPHPWRRLMAAGLRFSIGTDSAASNFGLSLLDELRFVHQRGAGAPPPAELLRMATLDGAAALGMEARIGSLAPGKLADLAWFAGPDADDPHAALLTPATACRGVWVGGEIVR